MSKPDDRILQAYKDLGIPEKEWAPDTGKYDFAKQWREFGLTKHVPIVTDSRTTPTYNHRTMSSNTTPINKDRT